MCAHNGQLGVALTLGATLPSHSAIQRWFGEPVRAVIVPTSTFQANKRGFPALSKAHQAVLLSFFQLNVQVQLSCNAVTWSCRLLREGTPLPSHTPPRCCFSAWLVTHHKFCSCCFSGQSPSPLLDPLFCCFSGWLWPSSCCLDTHQQQQRQVCLWTSLPCSHPWVIGQSQICARVMRYLPAAEHCIFSPQQQSPSKTPCFALK